jgi:hypothetical protein
MVFVERCASRGAHRAVSLAEDMKENAANWQVWPVRVEEVFRQLDLANFTVSIIYAPPALQEMSVSQGGRLRGPLRHPEVRRGVRPGFSADLEVTTSDACGRRHS